MKIKVGVLFGGRSVENEISVVTAIQTIESINKDKYEIIPIYIAKNGHWFTGEKLLEVKNYKDMDSLFKSCTEVYFKPIYGDYNLYANTKSLFGEKVVSKIDVILPTLHGTNCEDGTLQGVLSAVGMPFVGCNTLASANGMDKITMKMILKESGIPVVDYFWFNDKQWYGDKDAVVEALEAKLEYPVIVKPANSGSSVGISAAHNREELIASVDSACTFTTRIIVEKLVQKLKEINCSVLGNYEECEPSVCEVPVRSGEILSYSDKYMGGGGSKGSKSGGTKSQGMRSTKREIPAILPEGVTEMVQDLACKTFRVLACDGVSRIDFIMDEADGKVYVNEINTIPGSLSSYLWEYTGKPFPQVVDKLISLAFARRREEDFKTVDFGGNIFTHLGEGTKMGKK